MNLHKKANEAREEMLIEGLKRELLNVRLKPQISENSRKLVAQNKGYAPIYSSKRMLQMSAERRQRLEKISKLALTPKARGNKVKDKEKTKKKPLRVSNTKQIKKSNASFCWRKPKRLNNTLFSDLSNISFNASSSLLMKTHQSDQEETTEEQELHRNCSFRPLISKRSRKIFAKNNTRRKSVVERVMDYEKYRKIVHKERIADSIPTFTPDISKSRKSFKPNLNTTISQKSIKQKPSTSHRSKDITEKLQAIERLKKTLAKRPKEKALLQTKHFN